MEIHLFWTQQPCYDAEGTVRGVGGRSEEDLGSKQGCEQLQRLDWRFPLVKRLYLLKVRLGIYFFWWNDSISSKVSLRFSLMERLYLFLLPVSEKAGEHTRYQSLLTSQSSALELCHQVQKQISLQSTYLIWLSTRMFRKPWPSTKSWQWRSGKWTKVWFPPHTFDCISFHHFVRAEATRVLLWPGALLRLLWEEEAEGRWRQWSWQGFNYWGGIHQLAGNQACVTSTSTLLCISLQPAQN